MISGYRNAIKRAWADRIWESIAIHCKEFDGYILTLAGKAFLDLKHAKRHGIKKSRIIGVDLDAEVNAHNRLFNRTVLQANLAEVIPHFNRPIAAINADFCCGAMSGMVGDLIRNWMFSEWAKHAMLVVNVSVGREVQKRTRLVDGSTTPFDFGGPNTHRAVGALIYWCTSHMVYSFCNQTDQDVWDAYSDARWKTALQIIMSEIEKNLVLTDYYVAHRTRMDSAIIKPFSRVRLPYEKNKIKGHIAAKMAHHTMRFQS